jgi:hypothetical protein
VSIGLIGERRTDEPNCGAIQRSSISQPPYSPHAANASLNARSPGAPFSIAMMARRWLRIDQRHVEPGALLQELQIAASVSVDIGQPDQEEADG